MEKRRRRFALPAQSKMRLLRRNVRFRVRHGSPRSPTGGPGLVAANRIRVLTANGQSLKVLPEAIGPRFLECGGKRSATPLFLPSFAGTLNAPED